MNLFVGTSGWYYDWNKKKNLDWFVQNSGLNAVELNASYYSFPFPNRIKSWSMKGAGLRWSIKVHRSITHFHLLSETALENWENFRKLFEPMDHLIDFYLFQMPPKFNDVTKALRFADNTCLGKRFALEIRNNELLRNDELCTELKDKVTLVSVDSPDFRERIFPGEVIYMRMHGRENWYNYNYSREEIKITLEKINELKPENIYIYFNNNHNMLENAKLALKTWSAL